MWEGRLSLLAFAGGAIQLVPDGTLLVHLVLIVVMVGLLNKTLLRPISRVLKEREGRTEGRREEAETVLASAKGKALEYERQLRAARGLGYALLDEERSVASQERDRMVSDVRAEVGRWCDEEREKLKQDEADVKTNLMEDARGRASEIGVRILGRPVRLPEQ